MTLIKEYFISKLSFREDKRLIQDVVFHEYDGNELSSGDVVDREFLVTLKARGIEFSALEKNEQAQWVRSKQFTFEGGFFHWGVQLPRNIKRRKTFVSYYHHDDEIYRSRFQQLFDDLVITKSVEYNDIDPDNSDAYIKKLIQMDYLSDTTVLVVLIGPKTKCRKHVDWEISGSLDLKIGDKYSGLLGLKLPSHPDFGTGKHTYEKIPERLSLNLKSGYARIADWTDDRVKLQNLIEEAYENRERDDLIINKELPQMQTNLCE